MTTTAVPSPFLALLVAILDGDVAGVARAIARGAPANGPPRFGIPPLILAAAKGDTAICRLLLEAGADPNRSAPGFHRPLDYAEVGNHAATFRLLLEHGADPMRRSDPWDVRQEGPADPAIFRERLALAISIAEGDYGRLAREPHGSLLLAIAARCGAHEIIEALLGAGARPFPPVGISGRSALHEAAAAGDTESCRLLLVYGADPNVPDRLGRTPLHYAAAHGHVGIVELLIDAGADPDARAEWEETPIHEAARSGHAKVIDILVHRGASAVAEYDGEFLSPLFWAAKGGHDEAVAALVRAGVDPGIPRRSGQTVLHLAAFWGHASTCRLLVSLGVDPNVRDWFGVAPLHEAVQSGNPEACIALLDTGAQVDARDEADITPLHKAAEYGLAETCGILVRAGADPMARDREGKTPLHYAARFPAKHENPFEASCVKIPPSGPVLLHDPESHREVIRLLIEAGADPNATDRDGRTPLHEAKETNAWEAMEALIALGADPRLVFPHEPEGTASASAPLPPPRASARPRSTLIEKLGIYAWQELVADPQDPAVTDSEGATPLHVAAREGAWLRCLALLRNGADPNARDREGRTPLHLATGIATQILLEGGADPNACDRHGRTPLHAAVQRVKAVDMHALLDRSDHLGCPLQRAIARREEELEDIKALLDGGADPNIADGDGDTPLHMAARSRDHALCRILIRHGADPEARNHSLATPAELVPELVDRGLRKFLEKAAAERLLSRVLAASITQASSPSQPAL